MTEKIDFDGPAGVEALVKRLGGLRPCAARLGLAVGTVQGWKKRGSVPLVHQQKIRDLLQEKVEDKDDDKVEEKAAEAKQTKGEEVETASYGMEHLMGGQKSKQESKQESKPAKRKEEEGDETVEEVAMEEEIVSAFTSSDDASYSDEGLNISSEVWEHAALPRSTSGQWAILIALIALVGVLTRPLWAERIDAKLMGVLDGGGHGSTAQHDKEAADGEGAQGEHEQEGQQGEHEQGEAQDATTQELTEEQRLALPPDLLARLEALERDLQGVSTQQATPAAAELRRLKSESDALTASFDNQSARLDSLNELLQRRAQDLSRLRAKVERLEQNRATERLASRLNALFQLENIAYAVAQRSVFSLEALESSLQPAEREQMEGELSRLREAKNLASPQQLLGDYRRLLPDLLAWQARRATEQGGAQQGFISRVAQSLRAQMFGVFSFRRRYGYSEGYSEGDGNGDGEEEQALFAIESMLVDGRLEQAEEKLLQASPTGAEAKRMLGDESAAQLEVFRTALSSRNGVFQALRNIRSVLSSRETGESSPEKSLETSPEKLPRQPSS